jgi:hypothetical protein
MRETAKAERENGEGAFVSGINMGPPCHGEVNSVIPAYSKKSAMSPSFTPTVRFCDNTPSC